MEPHLQHLRRLRALASEAEGDVITLQRQLAAKMRSGDLISREEMFAVQALMRLAAALQSLYLREMGRS